MSYISWKVGTRDKQDFILSGRVQVCVLTLCDMQLLCAVYVQLHSAEMIILPKSQQHCEGDYSFTDHSPDLRQESELILKRKHLSQRALLAGVIKISASGCSTELPKKGTSDGCSQLRN